MNIKNISYPHPVLCNEDDVQGLFNVKFSHTLGKEQIHFDVNFELKNKTIEDLIKKKSAVYTIEIECSNTFYRESITTSKSSYDFKRDAKKMREKVSVKFCIRANQKIEGYVIEGCHKDYTGFQFNIDRGDILALGGTTSFFANKDFDPLKPAVSSFMAVKEDVNKEHGSMEIDYEDPEKIIIKLSKKDWKRYQEIKSMKWTAPIVHSAIVLPVLADAINLVNSNDSDTQDTHWFQRLQKIIEQKNLPDEALIAAQKILDDPINRCFDSIISSTEYNE